jgi:proline iminopeptidase
VLFAVGIFDPTFGWRGLFAIWRDVPQRTDTSSTMRIHSMSFRLGSVVSQQRLAAGGLALVLIFLYGCHRELTRTPATPLAPGEGYVTVPGGRIWYEVVGTGPGTPLLFIHGGPGGRSCVFAPVSKILGEDRPVILYDQLGGGQSDRPTDTTLWRLPRFLEEIDSLRAHLRLSELHIYGHSWGATVATEYFLTRHPVGVRSITLAGPLLSTPRWIEDANALRAQLPIGLQQVLSKHEAAGTIDAPEYRAVSDSFYARHGSRRRPVVSYQECEGSASNDTIYRFMWGPTEFHATGTLRGYDVTSRLGEFDLPVLFLAGEFDEARPQTVREFQRLIRGARFEMIPNAGHSIITDERDRVIAILRGFLQEVEER